MKKVFLTVALVFAGYVTSAQDLSGRWFLEGNVGFNSLHSTPGGGNGTTATDISIAPGFGKFINDNTAWGVSVLWNHGSNKYNNESMAPATYNKKYNEFGVGANCTKYWNFSERLGAFGRFSLPITYGNSDYVSYKTKTFGTGIYFTPGLAFKASNTLFFEVGYVVGGLQYFHYNGGGSVGNGFGFNVDTDELVGELNVSLKFVL